MRPPTRRRGLRDAVERRSAALALVLAADLVLVARDEWPERVLGDERHQCAERRLAWAGERGGVGADVDAS